MYRLRALISAVLIFSLFPTAFADADGLQFRLSEGVAHSEAKPPVALAPAVELSQSDTENVLKRMPPMRVDANGVQEFALRPGSLPPPRTGNTVAAAFPAATTRANEPVTAGPLEVVRYSPEG